MALPISTISGFSSPLATTNQGNCRVPESGNVPPAVETQRRLSPQHDRNHAFMVSHPSKIHPSADILACSPLASGRRLRR
jgi:hypothetical protein